MVAQQSKKTFIPSAYRPIVPGSALQSLPKASLVTRGCQDSKLKPLSSYLIIGAKEDVVIDAFLKEVAQAGLSSDQLPFHSLSYDDLGVLWDFSFYRGELLIRMEHITLLPRAIYHRHPGIPQGHLHAAKHLAFFDALEHWSGNVLGQRRDHYHNFSKMYQAATSLKTCISQMVTREKKDTNKCRPIKMARSFFIKGDFASLKDHFSKPLVVKSCSSIRSRVATQDEFEGWDPKNLKNIPTLFQEKIEGVDVRVHLCGDSVWALLIKGKDSIDYRYATRELITYSHFDLEARLKRFCKLLGKIENNKLIGIDFVHSEGVYYCLESNPGPGWSMFDHPSKHHFAKVVLQQLNN